MIPMENRRQNSLNLLMDSVEGPNLLLEYFSNFSERLFQARDFKSILLTLYEELHRVYNRQNIEILLTHDQSRLLRFTYSQSSGQMVPTDEIETSNTIYHYILQQRQPVLTNNYRHFCTNLGLEIGANPPNSLLGVPLIVRGKVLGIVIISDHNIENYLRIQDRQFLMTISNMVSYAVENLYLYDYIVEKNGSFKLFETVFPTGKKSATVREIITQLLNATVQKNTVEYSGIFIASRASGNWRMLDEKSRHPRYAQLAIELLKHWPDFPEKILTHGTSLFWHAEINNELLDTLLKPVLPKYQLNAALIYPFQITGTHYQGIWFVGFHRKPEPPTEDERQFFNFIFYILHQLLEKRALLELKHKYEKHFHHLERMKLVGELASGAAHHLNNILSVIIGKAQILGKKLESTAFERDIQLILRAAQDGAVSIRRLQDVIIRRSEMEEFTLVNINQLIEEVIESLRPKFEKEAQFKGIHYDLDLNFTPVRAIRGDAVSLREAILNIIQNALEAMPNGGKLSIQTSDKDNKVLLFISDTGVGIPPDIQKKIFEPFFTTKGSKGNGLGLSIVAETIKKHHGTVYVDSIPNKGTIFMIELPVANKRVLPFSPQKEMITPTDKFYKVLLVDDEGIVRETLAEMLEEEGFEVSMAANADEALLKFQKVKPDAVFTDLSMPGINGIELARRIKQLDSRVPVLIITGWNQMDSQMIQSNKFVDGIIQKPFEANRIREELDRILSRNGRSSRSSG